MDLFIPTCQRDLPQASLLLRSLDTFLDRGAVTSINLASIDRPDVFGQVRQVATHKFHSCTNYLRPSDLGLPEVHAGRGHGWKLQQAAKLSFARQASSDFFMVLDSKNLALHPIRTADLLENGRARWMPEAIGIHGKWWRGSAWALAHKRFDRAPTRVAISSATPVIFHTRSVVSMIDWLEWYHGEPLQRFFDKRRLIRDRIMRATEFTLYYMYMDREGLRDRYHVLSDRLHDKPSQIWASSTPSMREERLRRMLSGRTTGLFTGIAFAAWEALGEADRAALDTLAAGGSAGMP
jgi:hypothetical protein